MNTEEQHGLTRGTNKAGEPSLNIYRYANCKRNQSEDAGWEVGD